MLNTNNSANNNTHTHSQHQLCVVHHHHQHGASTSLLQLPIQQLGGGRVRSTGGGGGNGRRSANASPTPSEEELLLLPPQSVDGMLRPKYSLNLRPEDCGVPPAHTAPATPPARFQQQQQQQRKAPTKTIPRVSTLAQVNRHHQHQNSTDSAPASANDTSDSSSKKRKEMWANAAGGAGPCSFHQSFDIRPDPVMLSNSCSNIIVDDHQPENGGGTGARGFRTERRSAFCSGESSREPRGTPFGHGMGTMGTPPPLYCTAPTCSGHTPCSAAGGNTGASASGTAAHHRPPFQRSAHSSFDECDRADSHRDTYLGEISREWMLMNGAITPFKNILQQASSIASTPLANHRQIQQQQQHQSQAGPAGPAAAAAVSTASAIIGNRVGTKLAAGGSGDDDWMGPFATSLRGSCHNLAALTAAATASPLVLEQFNRRNDSFSSSGAAAGTKPDGPIGSGNANAASAAAAGGPIPEPIIIIEPKEASEGDPLLKKSLSLVLNDDDVEAQRQQQQPPSSTANGPTAAGTGSIFGSICGVPTGGAGGGGSEKGGGGPGSVLMDDSSCSNVKQPLVKEKERGGRFIKRQQLFNKRRVTSDYALFFALFGIVLMIVENEFAYEEYTTMCSALKTVILLSTIILVGLVVKFHVHEIQIFMNANSAEDWKIALTGRKTMQILVEIVACAICPLPVQMDVFVTTVNADGQAIPMRMPLDVLFSILMFFRLYWLCRVMLLHSRLFTDAASRSIAGLNRVKTDAKFILKTLMTICPGTVLMLFTATLWMIGGYILRLCERHHTSDGDPILLSVQAEKHQSYLNSLWLIAVTFLSIGYGDIVPNTQCGRIMAVVTGILGTCTSSMVVAVIARKLELTRAEKHVHNFMIESQHTKEMKHIAANVLRETWLIYKHRRLVDKIEPSRIRYHQRKFLVAICALRKLKTSQRKLDENRVSLGDVAKTTSHSHELMRDVHTTQEGVALRITAVEHQLSDIQRELNDITELLKFALRPALEYSCAQQQQQQQMLQSPMMTSTIATQMPMPSVPSIGGGAGAGFGICAASVGGGGPQSPMMLTEFRQRQRKPSTTTISEPLG